MSKDEIDWLSHKTICAALYGVHLGEPIHAELCDCAGLHPDYCDCDECEKERRVMTDAELNFAIASYLEPEPIDKSMWSKQRDMYAHSFYRGEWVPRDMTANPEMTVLLLKKLMEHRTEGGHVLFMNDGKFSFDGGTAKPPKDFQREVAITFARAHGIWKD